MNRGLDAGLTLSEAKEVLVQLYAYVGFPRSLNALGEPMQVVAARQRRGLHDAPGREPEGAIPGGDELLALGTAKSSSRPACNGRADSSTRDAEGERVNRPAL